MLLSTLPPIAPPAQHILATSHTAHRLTSGHSLNSSSDHTTGHPPHRNRREPKSAPLNKPASLSLAALAQSEDLIEHRKNAIATFGYSWIKPAGCTKTMLGRREEELEREELDRQIREAEEAEMRGGTRFDEAALMEGEGEGEDDGLDQRDLDDDVPDADADQTNLDEGDDEGNETGFTAEDLGEGEDTGFITGDQTGPIDMTAMEEEDLMMGGDLDDDVPSAEQSRLEYDDNDGDGGEWQHTDTEDEFESSSIMEPPRSQIHQRSARRRSTGIGVGEDSEMMDMDITHATIDDSYTGPSSSIPQNTHRMISGNAFATPPHSHPSASSTSPAHIQNQTHYPSSINNPHQQRGPLPQQNEPRSRRSWFSTSHRTPSNRHSPNPPTPNFDLSSSAAPPHHHHHPPLPPAQQTQPQPRLRRNLWARATERGGNLFSSSSTTTPTTNNQIIQTPQIPPSSSDIRSQINTTPSFDPTGDGGGSIVGPGYQTPETMVMTQRQEQRQDQQRIINHPITTPETGSGTGSESGTINSPGFQNQGYRRGLRRLGRGTFDSAAAAGSGGAGGGGDNT
ncbi:hypothetical protein UCRPC4_g02799 [Phaeomoniella chlamydospora]|uniref:Uncharacterized protein n=1 Tax=Phaeomoniella chlamydospora TaxID=158046 RepID=A0A0G2ELQ0_PHACM|nr:hypothetical protein UCRPC4_g02799 [Phaeomoniella chlamydospora]